MRQTSTVETWKRTWSRVTLLLLLSAAPIFAATITVTSTGDSGPGSLRAAIASAANGDTINFNLVYPATIVLSTPLTLGPSVTITGPGVGNLAISGADSVGVLIVNAGATAQVSGVTFTQGASGLGGCIFNSGTLTLTNTAVTNCRNFAELGGGILNAGSVATLNLNGSTVTANFAGACLQAALGAGGGIFNYLGTVNLSSSTVSGNITTGGPGASGSCFEGGAIGWGGGGGGIFNFFGTLLVNTSTISANVSSFGGGIFNSYGALTLVNSTIAENGAGATGGGIYTQSDSAVTVSFSTIWNNIANNGQGFTPIALTPPSTGGGGGGGCCIFIADVYNSGGAGILYAEAAEGTPTMSVKNSILSNYGDNCQGQFISAGYNLSDDGTCLNSLTQTSDLNNTAAGLDPGGLKNNGGPTQTVALLATSSAVNAIPLSSCTDASGNPVTTDQRGVRRPQGSGCDIGAFEYFHSHYMVPAVQTFLLMDAVEASTLPRIVQGVLTLPLQAAVDFMNQGNAPVAVGQLEAFVVLVDVVRLAGGLSQQQAAAWATSAQGIIQSLRSGSAS